MITQVINAIRLQDLSTQMFALQRGLAELETWADIEWYVSVRSRPRASLTVDLQSGIQISPVVRAQSSSGVDEPTSPVLSRVSDEKASITRSK